MIKKYIKICLLSLALVSMSSCNDFIDLDPQSEWKLEDFYETSSQIEVAFAGMYGNLRGSNLFGSGLSMEMAYGTDEGSYNRAYDELWRVSLNLHNSMDNDIAGAWKSLYTIIHNANNMITYTDPVNFEDEEYKNIIGEARFLRAFCHMTLTYWWNEIPLRDKPTTDQSSNDIEVSSLEDIYDFIIADFEYACSNLPHVTSENYLAGRAHQMAAHGMLARLYLKMAGYPHKNTEGFAKALAHCDTIMMEDGYHQLRTSADSLGYENLFRNMIGGDQYDLEENMFEITFTNNLDIGMGTMGSNGVNNGLLFGEMDGVNHPTTRQFFVQASPLFNILHLEEDKRKLWNVPAMSRLETGNNVRVKGPLSWAYAPGKFRRWEPADYADLDIWKADQPYVLLTNETNISINQSPINFPILRYADILLMYAEAANEVNGGPTGEAIAALNQVRQRAGLEIIELGEPEALGGKDAFFNELVDERFREFAFEGIRKHDLIRWELYEEKLQTYASAIEGEPDYDEFNHAHYLRSVRNFDINKHLSLPYPFQEVTINKLLDQKPEWN
ncbi:RagB/SusD family nutrient uptake outer membrane protein [Saccharicrinis aurantiacus]|uniref:RagB/SusD family nutrient uptake outer membrane protein n=1 Tax=Saccharicrinis aurantiacus TaxID=1849719 RepID=UPI0009FAC7DD|nr:RagB/SusD family nutrient uptake outer membrane protein [Saccharicrinis aurantiacus]